MSLGTLSKAIVSQQLLTIILTQYTLLTRSEISQYSTSMYSFLLYKAGVGEWS